jgi:hypothetical protein
MDILEGLEMTQHISEGAKHVGDAVSVFTVLATLAAWLPPLAALFTIVWSSIRIWESKTVQNWIKRRRGQG